ncbi:MAG: hypothetical protein A3G25_09320 [Betaproteobacteria bacterium RIFCSPLOWO2_12_FULL_63_13]|nr:MAG: hypothetical protein A3G25_09320 [Betaproteobacteria bacterium RIFCSPLOWO2_12_FULL_63_13]
MSRISQVPIYSRLIALVGVLAVLLGLAAAWTWSPLRTWLDVDLVVSELRQWGQTIGPLAALGGFTLAITLAVPLTFLTLVALVAFGPLAGFAYSLCGACLGSVVTYGIGRFLGREVVERLAGNRVNALSRRLAERGLLAIIAVRLVPVAPFAVVNMVAGASHIRLRDMVLGTAIGMTPATLAMMFFVDHIIRAIREPGPLTLFLLLLTVGLIALGVWGVRRWFKKSGDLPD